MSDKEIRGGHGDPGADEERPRVKVTDRRRVRMDGPTEAPPQGPEIGPGEPEEQGGQKVQEGQEGFDGQPDPGADAAAGSDVEEARSQAAEYREHLQRLAAEFDNYRKRVLKEQTRAVDMASRPLVQKLLEVLDDFDLALMAAERRPDFEQFLRGVELVYAKLLDILRSEGLVRIEAEGKPFDPELHEALMQSGEGQGEPVVADVLRPGYLLKGQVIRPAGVKVVRR